MVKAAIDDVDALVDKGIGFRFSDDRAFDIEEIGCA